MITTMQKTQSKKGGEILIGNRQIRLVKTLKNAAAVSNNKCVTVGGLSKL